MREHIMISSGLESLTLLSQWAVLFGFSERVSTELATTEGGDVFDGGFLLAALSAEGHVFFSVAS